MGLGQQATASDAATARLAAVLAPPQPGWMLSLYPQAGEGGGCFVSSYRPDRTYVARGKANDPERSAQQAARRARTALRRYCAANGLNRLGTLTYAGAGCHDPLQTREHVRSFFRALRAGLGGAPLAYVWVPEWHKSGHGLHVHFAVGRYAPVGVIRAAWGRGHVHIKLLSDLPVGSGRLEEARQSARYLTKYVAKTFADPTTRVLGLHRYGLAQGFQPTKVTYRGRSPEDVLDQASDLFGMQPARVWSSADEPEWSGPPAIWAQWAG